MRKTNRCYILDKSVVFGHPLDVFLSDSRLGIDGLRRNIKISMSVALLTHDRQANCTESVTESFYRVISNTHK